LRELTDLGVFELELPREEPQGAPHAERSAELVPSPTAEPPAFAGTLSWVTVPSATTRTATRAFPTRRPLGVTTPGPPIHHAWMHCFRCFLLARAFAPGGFSCAGDMPRA